MSESICRQSPSWPSISSASLPTKFERAGADPSNITFEITETALMRDITKGEAFARGVVDLGCGVSLDDFGTGFGTFTYLKKLPLTYLKIDLEFVRDLVGVLQTNMS